MEEEFESWVFFFKGMVVSYEVEVDEYVVESCVGKVFLYNVGVIEVVYVVGVYDIGL